MSLADELAEIPLVDQHCHAVVVDPLDRTQFELLLTESRAELFTISALLVKHKPLAKEAFAGLLASTTEA